jgi:hypothetical protein
MASDSGIGQPGDHGHADGSWQSGGRRTPDSGHGLRLTNSNPATGSLPPAAPWPDELPRKSSERNRSRNRSGRSASGQVRMCKKCGEQLTGQFVRALDGTFHLDCFKCRVSSISPPRFWICLETALLCRPASRYVPAATDVLL